MAMVRKHLLSVAISLCLAIGLKCSAQVVDGPQGPVEFVGLKQWKASELFEAIQEQEPGRPFHACAAVLKSNLEFPDAAAFIYMDSQPDGTWDFYTVVVGVEDGSGVRYRTPGNESLTLPEAWLNLQNTAVEDFNTLSAAVHTRYSFSDSNSAKELAIEMGANAESFDEVWRLVDGKFEEKDHQLAIEVLERDTSWSARAVATVILGHFPESATTWHGLVSARIDPDFRVSDLAGKVLQGFIRSDKAMPIDWSKARETLLALFGGTNPFAFNDTLELLVATDVATDFAQDLSREVPQLLLAYAGAEHGDFRKAAHSFLKAISAEDFGTDVESWEAWLKRQDSDS